MDVSFKNSVKNYEDIISSFCKNNGKIVVCSNDSSFIELVRSTICLFDTTQDILIIHDLTKLLGNIQKNNNKKNKLIIFIENYLYGEPTFDKLSYIKEISLTPCKIICLTSETDRPNLIYMHEMGADNIIVKPVSVTSLIEKLAFTIYQDNNLKSIIHNIHVLIEQHNFVSAKFELDKLFAQKPNSCIGYMLLGDLYLYQHDFINAELNYSKATETAHLYLEPLKRMVELYNQTNENDKKLKYLLKLDVLSPLNHHRKIEIGSTYIKLEQFAKADFYFEQSLLTVQRRANEMAAAACMEIAQSISEQHSDLSLKYMKQALELKSHSLSSQDVWMFNSIGLLLRRSKKWKESIEYYEKALAFSPNNGGLYYNIGMAYLEGNDNVNALNYFEKAIIYSPSLLQQSPIPSYNIGLLYYKLHDYNQAQIYFQKCLQIDPTYDVAKTMLSRINM